MRWRKAQPCLGVHNAYMTDYSPYQLNGPRYTSYPSANHFGPGVEATSWARAAQRSNQDLIPAPLSVYVHVPFCSSPCFFCACTRVITRDTAVVDRYLGYLEREIALQAALFHRDRVVQQLHFGGGTPSSLGPDGLRRLMRVLREHYTLADDDAREFGIELDPRVADAELLDVLVELGFNRVSLGIQDFDPAVQAAVNRVQSAEATLGLLAAAQERGFQAINVDLICGLPHQTLTGFAATLERVVAARPDRIAMYGYAHLPELFKGQRRIRVADLPDLAGKLALLKLADDTLTGAGYVMIGLDHYALPDDPLALALADGTLQRNFQGYSTHAYCDLIAHGLSGIGMVGDCYAQNARTLPEYYAALDEGRLPIVRGLELTVDDRLRGAVIHDLMCTGSVDLNKRCAEYGVDTDGYFAAECARLAELAADGLVTLDERGFALTDAGRPVMRVVAMAFDAYLAQAPGRYSKAV